MQMPMTPTTMHDGLIMITWARLVEYQMSQKSKDINNTTKVSVAHIKFYLAIMS